jgi:hypothetical protein
MCFHPVLETLFDTASSHIYLLPRTTMGNIIHTQPENTYGKDQGTTEPRNWCKLMNQPSSGQVTPFKARGRLLLG